MKEIKFRAWDKKEKKMISWTAILKDKVSMGAFKLKTGVWMQFIGLKDKNKKEIYEGDVVRFDKGVVIVKWLEKLLMFNISPNYDSDGKVTGRLIKELKICEVIGNIYENPELLEVQK